MFPLPLAHFHLGGTQWADAEGPRAHSAESVRFRPVDSWRRRLSSCSASPYLRDEKTSSRGYQVHTDQSLVEAGGPLAVALVWPFSGGPSWPMPHTPPTTTSAVHAPGKGASPCMFFLALWVDHLEQLDQHLRTDVCLVRCWHQPCSVASYLLWSNVLLQWRHLAHWSLCAARGRLHRLGVC